MTSKEFDLLISAILELMKSGQYDTVIKLLENARSKPDKDDKE